jgi:hypothetical protein
MEGAALEGLAEALYREAGFEPDEPESPVAIARKVIGADAVEIVPPGALRFTPAQLALVNGRWRIFVRRSEPQALTFSVAHELAHWALRREGYQGQDEERLADYLGACLIAPAAAFARAVKAVGDDMAELSEIFGTTQSLVALRWGERTSTPLALVRPGLVRVRSQLEFVWPDERTIRRWAHGTPPKGLAKTKLTDDPRRVLLMADELAELG